MAESVVYANMDVMKQPHGLHVAVVGLGFGQYFAPLYRDHPNVGKVTLCDIDPNRLSRQSELLGISDCATELRQILNDPTVDAVHLCTDIPSHARQTIEVLKNGKHCACAVPMATTLEDVAAIIAAQRSSGKNYMMMETQNYSQGFFYAQDLIQDRTFGELQLLRGVHYQDMERWPAYWAGLPPMWYATHAIGPLLGLARTRARSVRCLGSGVMREELRERYNNPYPIESALFELDRDTPLTMEITRSLFHCGRQASEGFSVYGENAAFEWQQVRGEQPALFRMPPVNDTASTAWGRESTAERVTFPSYADRLPSALAAHASGHHGGSHPHLVHEFVMSIVEHRKSAVDEVFSANTTAAGVCAHQSAMGRGERIEIPRYQ